MSSGHMPFVVLRPEAKPISSRLASQLQEAFVMQKRFAASLVLTALAAGPLQAAPVVVPVTGLQGAGGRTLATKVWISNYAGETKSYSSVFRQTDGVVADEALRGDVPGERAVFFNKASAREETGLLEIEAADLRVDA